MPATHLRLYRGTEETQTEGTSAPAAGNVSLPVGEIIPLLADAYNNRRTWLSDFEDDEVTISSDLYEVLLAYRFLNRPA